MWVQRENSDQLKKRVAQQRKQHEQRERERVERMGEEKKQRERALLAQKKLLLKQLKEMIKG